VVLTEYKPSDEWDAYCLRVTGRCLRDDLLEGANPPPPTEELVHELAQVFVEKRSQHPKGQETIHPLTRMNEVYTLHAGRWRGATWHDEVENVVWLLAGAIHRSGERDDLYPSVRGLDDSDQLRPTTRDYELMFEARDRAFFDVAYDQAAQLRRRADALSPREVSDVLGGRIPVSLALEDLEGTPLLTLAISWRWERGELEPPGDWLEILLAYFFPWLTNPLQEASPENTIAGRPSRPGEQIWAAFVES
jgi:hypothetical protein